MLELNNVHVSYGGRRVVHGVTLRAPERSIVALIGANGAGKTSILRSIMGLTPASSGEIRLFGERIEKLPTAAIVQRGIALSPEGRRVFPHMSVYENLQSGAYLQRDKALTGRTLQEIYDRFPRLAERRQQPAGTLSGGEQQMLAMGRALMAQPKVLLLDEPSLGLAPLVVREIAAIVRDINASRGLSVVLVEQNAHMALKLCHTAYVLEAGQLTLSGSGQELLESQHVRQAYLGL
ncbi:MAG: ABC transporter ATP-binding protein [Ottowia sp.]|uniref:ABC transporter ATP-binding protein n=1 Tax=Ottowia sp. TaxID=1898956 RepID=UPI003C76FD87